MEEYAKKLATECRVNSYSTKRNFPRERVRDNFNVINEDFSKHIDTMQEIINSFVHDPINSIQITEYASEDQFCKNTV